MEAVFIDGSHRLETGAIRVPASRSCRYRKDLFSTGGLDQARGEGSSPVAIERWSENILVVDLQDDPAFTDDVASLLDQLGGESEFDVVLNFRGVTYLNSSNIAKLLKLRRKVQSQRRRIVLSEIDTNVWGLFLVTGLDKVFDFTDSVATGLASLQLSAESPAREE